MRGKMTNKERAKIFMPFDALKGFREILQNQEIIKIEKKELSEDKIKEIDLILSKLKKGMLVKITYYNNNLSSYQTIEGVLTNIDIIYKTITIVKNKINIVELYDIEIIEEEAI